MSRGEGKDKPAEAEFRRSRPAREVEDDGDQADTAPAGRPADDDEEAGDRAAYRRRSKPVSVRRGVVTRQTARRLGRVLKIGLPVVVAAGLAWAGYRFITGSSGFELSDSSHIAVVGSQQVQRTQVLDCFGSDLSRNVFFIPLRDRRVALEQIPWVKSATVMRLWPNRIEVRLQERTPVAFARVAGHPLMLIDGDGVLMERPAKANFDFPILTGLSESQPREERRRRVRLYMEMASDLESDGGHHMADFSEIDLQDASDARAVLVPSGDAHAILLHLGEREFLGRYKIYLAHIQQWRQQFPSIDAIDLRYDGQVIVNPGAPAPKAAGDAAAPAAGLPTPTAGAAAAPKPGTVAPATKRHAAAKAGGRKHAKAAARKHPSRTPAVPAPPPGPLSSLISVARV